MVFSTCGLLIANALVGKDLVGNRRIAVCVVIAFLFSLAVGYLWEIYEFTLDSLTGSSLQCWQNGVLQQFGNGTYLVSDAQGTGLKDTLGDMIVNLIGTVVFLVPATVVFLKKENTLRLFAWQRLHRRRRH
jgi:Na+-driven multidrug efflux pump